MRRRHNESPSAVRPPSPEYRTWIGMKLRCLNVNRQDYPRYGGRGISICERWEKSYEQFLADMGRRPTPQYSLDRIDTNGMYEPGNCQWATRSQQSRNRRDRNLVVINGESRLLCDWSSLCGLSVRTLWNRIHVLGWSPEKAISAPPRTYGNRQLIDYLGERSA